jgi:glycosyltransferase involved in cell wall biosynthesis
MKTPSILLIGPTPPPHHGMTTFIRTLLESPELNRRYRLVHLDSADRRSHGNMGQLDVRNVVLALRHAVGLARLLVRERPELVYLPVAQNRWAYVRDSVWMLLARSARVPVFVHLHGGGFRDFYETTDPLTRWLVRRTSRWLAGVAVLGEGLRGIYQGLVPDDRIHVVPNGVPDPFPDGATGRERGVGGAPGPVRILHLGTLIRSKGFPDLIRAVARLREGGGGSPGVDVALVLAGGWNSEAEREEAESSIAALGLEGVVEMPGVVAGASKRRALAEGDLFALPTCYPPEGQPLVILEAMAAGLPVVASPRAAIPDMVEDGVTGLLVAEGDDAALEAALRRLAESPAERAAMGRAARRRYLERFTEERMIGRLCEVLDGVLGVERAAEAVA